MAPPRGQYQTKLNAVMFTMMIEELLSGPCTAKTIAEYTGMAVITVQRTLRVMHRRKIVHISGYEQDATRRWVIRVFSFGNARDAKRPPPRDKNDRQRDRRARLVLEQAHLAITAPTPALMTG
jgi:hypothetical protein